MATNLSSTGLDIDKVEHSDIPTGATDKVLLYASGSGSDTRLYVKAGSNTQKQLGFDIDQFDALGGTGVAQGDHFIFSDAGTEKKITFSNLEDAIFANVSGQAAIAAGGALSLDVAAITGQTEMTGDVADADEFMISDGGVLKRADFSVVRDAVFADVSGDATVASGGALTIAAGAVEHGMLADDIISGQAELAHADIADADDMMISDATDGAVKKVGVDSLRDHFFGVVSGDATIADGGALTIATDAVESGMLNDNVISGQSELAHADIVDADELMISDGGVLKKVGVDSLRDHFFGVVSGDATIADGGALTIAATSVENGMLAGSIANNKLANDSVTVGSTEIDLGASSTVLAGITQLTASNIQVTNLDVVTLNSVSQTETTLEIADKLIVAALSASSANSDGGGLKIGGGQNSAGNASVLYDHSNTALDFNIGGTTEIRLEDGALRPETDSDVDLGADGAAYKKLYVDDVDLNGQGRVDLDADADTSIRSSADDQIDFEVGGADLVAIKSTGLHIVDDKKLVFGSNDDASFEYDEDGNDVLLYAGASMRFSDDVKLQFGTGGDASIEYDEDGTDELRFAGAAVTFEQAVSFDGNLTLGNASSDVSTAVSQVTASAGLYVANHPLYVASNVITDSGAAAIAFDGSGNTSLQGSLTTGNGYSNGGMSITSNGSGSFAGDLIVGDSANASDGGDATFHGSVTGEKAFYSSANNVFQVTGSAASGLQVSIGGDATSEYAVDVANGSNNNNKMRAAAFVTYSDESLKEDVASMSNTALDTVMSLEGVEFTWKDSGERDFGFIAQDVQSVLPKAVHTADDGVQGVDYSRLTSVLVEAVKAQQVQIEELKALLKK
jgi:hypothetical protein